MAFSGTISSDSVMSALNRTEALQTRRVSAISCGLPVLSTAVSGTGFETLPPLAISFKPFQFLKSLELNTVGLGFDCVPFHSGWELVEWRPKLHVLESNYAKILEICEEIEEEEHLEVLGLELN